MSAAVDSALSAMLALDLPADIRVQVLDTSWKDQAVEDEFFARLAEVGVRVTRESGPDADLLLAFHEYLPNSRETREAVLRAVGLDRPWVYVTRQGACSSASVDARPWERDNWEALFWRTK